MVPAEIRGSLRTGTSRLFSSLIKASCSALMTVSIAMVCTCLPSLCRLQYYCQSDPLDSHFSILVTGPRADSGHPPRGKRPHRAFSPSILSLMTDDASDLKLNKYAHPSDQ
jgi:hypothetical protein